MVFHIRGKGLVDIRCIYYMISNLMMIWMGLLVYIIIYIYIYISMISIV